MDVQETWSTEQKGRKVNGIGGGGDPLLWDQAAAAAEIVEGTNGTERTASFLLHSRTHRTLEKRDFPLSILSFQTTRRESAPLAAKIEREILPGAQATGASEGTIFCFVLIQGVLLSSLLAPDPCLEPGGIFVLRVCKERRVQACSPWSFALMSAASKCFWSRGFLLSQDLKSLLSLCNILIFNNKTGLKCIRAFASSL